MVSRLKIKLFDGIGSKASAPMPPSSGATAAASEPGQGLVAPQSAQDPTKLAFVVAEPADNEAYWDGYDTQLGDQDQADFTALSSPPRSSGATLKRIGIIGTVSVLLVAGAFAGLIFYLGEDNPFKSDLAPFLDAIWGDSETKVAEDEGQNQPKPARAPKVDDTPKPAPAADLKPRSRSKPEDVVDIEHIYTALPNPLPKPEMNDEPPAGDAAATDKSDGEKTADGEKKSETTADQPAQLDQEKTGDDKKAEVAAGESTEGNKTQAKGQDAGAKKPREDYDPALAEAMDHEYIYQHYRAIQEIRESQIKKAGVLLRQGLVDRKFWNRMYSAIGLVEFGTLVTEQELSIACEDTRSELIANFFKRFVKDPSAAQIYVMRHVLRFADSRGRQVILEAIARYKDEFRPIYLVAATMDRSPKIQAWANLALKKIRLSKDKADQLRDEVSRYKR